MINIHSHAHLFNNDFFCIFYIPGPVTTLGARDTVRTRYPCCYPHGADLLFPLDLTKKQAIVWLHGNHSIGILHLNWVLPEDSQKILWMSQSPLLHGCGSGGRRVGCRYNISGDSESCAGEEKLSFYTPRFDHCDYEINWWQADYQEKSHTHLLMFNIHEWRHHRKKVNAQKYSEIWELIYDLNKRRVCSPLKGE